MTELTQTHFTSEPAARAYLEAVRWPNGAVCPHCGGADRQSKLEGQAHRPGLYFCGHCRQQYTVTVGTVFEDSKLPLNKWVYAVHLMCSSKKGISSKQLERMLEVTYKTAWFMSHRIRKAMESEGGLLGGPGSTIEADETYVGRIPGRRIGKGGRSHKDAVFALIERNGEVRSFHVPDVTAATLKKKLHENADRGSEIMTDEATMYKGLKWMFAGGHDTVNHSRKEYVRDNTHTNTIENYFSVFKRGLYGTYQHVSSQHLQRYASEFDFRHNTRSKLGVEDKERTAIALKMIGGKRLTYRRSNKGQAGLAE